MPSTTSTMAVDWNHTISLVLGLIALVIAAYLVFIGFALWEALRGTTPARRARGERILTLLLGHFTELLRLVLDTIARLKQADSNEPARSDVPRSALGDPGSARSGEPQERDQ
ncbi:hypothetical protein GFY24_09150 [Nocardia sp. SYP-A9097]|uniref:hypothetical protein n=1 Tax=Nocardia sp. SYP-A9097 TaxID=2663237 RepID=UPI00129C057C|nr:hypothetical protein [Nocardia sp. SYP-A9097]MRH87618.1 hypothetical protein [Nocardia sp. SYP-A9097]